MESATYYVKFHNSWVGEKMVKLIVFSSLRAGDTKVLAR